MIRFVPDHWFDGLMRPFLLLDPVAWLYTEIIAPDGRFAILLLLILLTTFLYRDQREFHFSRLSLFICFFSCFYLWVFITGNGRYFFWGFVLVGPMLVYILKQLPGSLAFRNTLIVGTVGLQGWVSYITFVHDAWSVAPWPVNSPSDFSLMNYGPSVFFTGDDISNSSIIKRFHIDSRWSHIASHQMNGKSIDHQRLAKLIDDPLPKYAVFYGQRHQTESTTGPPSISLERQSFLLSKINLELREGGCNFWENDYAWLYGTNKSIDLVKNGFWFCLVNKKNSDYDSLQSKSNQNSNLTFSILEFECPRILPPSSAHTQLGHGVTFRYYNHSDTGVYVYKDGRVFLKNYRAANPTFLGLEEDVIQGKFYLDCGRIPGRYQPPWIRFKIN